MLRSLFYNLVISLGLWFPHAGRSQCTKYPVFNGFTTSEFKVDNLNDYVIHSFRTRFHDYFDTSCGYYYTVVRFTIDSIGNVSNITSSAPKSDMTRFLKDILKTTNGHWSFTGCSEDSANKLGVMMPVYFQFMEHCPGSTTLKAYEEPMDKNYLSFGINGMTITMYSKESVVLFPIKLLGMIMEKHFIIKDSQ